MPRLDGPTVRIGGLGDQHQVLAAMGAEIERIGADAKRPRLLARAANLPEGREELQVSIWATISARRRNGGEVSLRGHLVSTVHDLPHQLGGRTCAPLLAAVMSLTAARPLTSAGTFTPWWSLPTNLFENLSSAHELHRHID